MWFLMIDVFRFRPRSERTIVTKQKNVTLATWIEQIVSMSRSDRFHAVFLALARRLVIGVSLYVCRRTSVGTGIDFSLK